MSNLKMVALVEGEEVVVGRCHPGQARLLQKKGLAEFREGKVWLHKPFPPASPPLNFEAPKSESAHQVRPDVRVPPGWTLEPDPPNISKDEQNGVFSRPFSEEVRRKAQATLDFEITGTPGKPGIDPEGMFSTPVPRVETRRCETLVQWLTEIQDRRAAGHHLFPADDPRSRMLGFVDDEDCLCFEVGLVAVKRAKAEDIACLGGQQETADSLQSPEGRAALLGYIKPPEPEGELPDDIWDSWVPKTPHPSNVVVNYYPTASGTFLTSQGVQHHHPMMVPNQPVIPHIRGCRRFHWPDDAARMVQAHANEYVLTDPPQGTKQGYLLRRGVNLYRLWVYPWDLTGHTWLDVATLDSVRENRDYLFQKRTEHPTVADALAYLEHPELAEG